MIRNDGKGERHRDASALPDQSSPLEVHRWLTNLDVQRAALGPWGAVRPIISAEWRGRRWVAIGRSLMHGNWKLFTDFLSGYLPAVIGVDWLREETQSTAGSSHPIASWWRQLANPAHARDGQLLANSGGISYMRLAYDLYLLEHHGSLEPRLLARLRDREQFQGARYELWAAATCVKAGCTVTFEDETDATTKHFEFAAVHEQTGQRFCVEAKSRVRPGVKGAAGVRSDPGGRPRIGQLLNAAGRKPFTDPAVIFIDLNLPTTPILSERDTAMRKIRQSVESTGESEPWNLLVLTNHPEEWDETASSSAPGGSVTVVARNPQRPVAHPQVWSAVAHAAKLAGKVPVTFDAMVVDADAE